MPASWNSGPCRLCGAPGDSREDVRPRWLNRRTFSVDDGPFYTWVNGQPVTKRDGTARTIPHLSPVLLWVCTKCNGALAARFESSGRREPVERLLTSECEPRLSATEARTVGLWCLKTLLLWAHPGVHEDDPTLDARAERWPVGLDLWRWAAEGSEPPPDLSVWLSRVDPSLDVPANEQREVHLPRVVTELGAVEVRMIERGIRSLNVVLVHHPGWRIERPLETEGGVARLWPPPDRAVDVASLPALGNRAVKWVQTFELAMSEEQLAEMKKQVLGRPIDLLDVARSGGPSSTISISAAPRSGRSAPGTEEDHG